jgi:hypothetical protein
MGIIIFTSKIQWKPSKSVSILIRDRAAYGKMNIKDLFGGEIVGTGSDFIVILKGKNRILLQFSSHKIIILRKEATPYGSSM